MVPPEVVNEMLDARAPSPVRTWAAGPPAWLEVRAPAAIDMTLPLDAGERAAIALAQELSADRLLIDEREGRAVAARLGIPVAGTLAVLRDAATAGVLNLNDSIERLKRTSFRASPQLYAELLDFYREAIRAKNGHGTT